MNVYIDKDNLVSYIRSSRDARFEDCNRMLKRKLDIKFTFSKDEILSLDKADAELVMMWMTQMSQGAGNSKDNVRWGVDFPPRPLKSNIHTTFSEEELSSVYLLNDEKIRQLKALGILLYGDIGNEVETLSSLIQTDDYGFTKQQVIEDMPNWDVLRDYTSPCSDIILVDQYVFAFEELYDVNICALIKETCSHAKDAKINIVILTLPRCYDKRTKRSFTPNWVDIKNRIRSGVESSVGVKPNVTFVLSSKLEEHDRSMFTNYNFFESGDTFNYFDSKWRVISDGRHIKIFSLADRDFFANSMRFVKDMQTIIDKVKRVNKDNIIGDQKSNYLKFD